MPNTPGSGNAGDDITFTPIRRSSGVAVRTAALRCRHLLPHEKTRIAKPIAHTAHKTAGIMLGAAGCAGGIVTRAAGNAKSWLALWIIGGRADGMIADAG